MKILLSTVGFLLMAGVNQASGVVVNQPATPSYPLSTTPWWEIPFQPPEKWFSPRQEDDEWYKQYQQKKYRKKR